MDAVQQLSLVQDMERYPAGNPLTWSGLLQPSTEPHLWQCDVVCMAK